MLTELDNCILGVIWRGGAMSAYSVRKHFSQSTTVAWSSSTGTIYPSIRRLRAAGYLDAAAPEGPRKSELLSLTAKGREALDRWLTEVPPEVGSSTADPIRTRVHFLAALPPAERRKAFADYRTLTQAKAEELRRKMEPRNGDAIERSERLGALGALMELEARLAWLDFAERELRSA